MFNVSNNTSPDSIVDKVRQLWKLYQLDDIPKSYYETDESSTSICKKNRQHSLTPNDFS